jgi:uncharacterized protein (DUF1697 family)
VALLRAVNVGGRTVTKDVLVRAVAAGGCADVSTFIASGNVLFSADGRVRDVESRIEAALRAETGLVIDAFVRTGADLRDAIEVEVPEGTAWNVAFLRRAPSAAATARLRALANDVDRFVVAGREVHWSCAVRQSESRFDLSKLERALDARATMRSITTVRRLAELVP